jgi:hypothetical protein
MSVSTEVQRTLVKSPPELWAELGDPEALARHLGELGEIRITSVEPETKVEWESDDARGVVQLKQSGWGTKVTLSVTRTPPAPIDTPDPDLATAVEPESNPTVEPESAVEPEATAESKAIVEPGPTVEQGPSAGLATPEPHPEPVAAEKQEPQEPQPKLGFFARLFRKRKPAAIAVAPAIEHEPEPEPEPEVVAMAAPEPIYPERPPEPEVDLAAELASVEEQMAQETTELLTGVLDRLGAAHHRPFSRG